MEGSVWEQYEQHLQEVSRFASTPTSTKTLSQGESQNKPFISSEWSILHFFPPPLSTNSTRACHKQLKESAPSTYYDSSNDTEKWTYSEAHGSINTSENIRKRRWRRINDLGTISKWWTLSTFCSRNSGNLSSTF